MRGAGKLNTKRFPNNFPSGCPPTDARSASGEVFRVVKNIELGPGDFLSLLELGRKVDADRRCQAAGLSVYRDKRDAALCREKYPKLGRKIAHGVLRAEHGQVKSTPAVGGTSHTTWWPYEGVVRQEPFKVVEEE